MKRDDYTCQDCGTFSLKYNNTKHFIHLSDFFDGLSDYYIHELHSYTYFGGYEFDIGNVNVNIEFCGSPCYIVFPVLQVHHLKYVVNKKSWEYDDSDLITLCKECHEKRHLKEEIPIYNETQNKKISCINNIILDKGDIEEHFSSFKPWSLLIKENGKYKTFQDYHNLKINILYLGEKSYNSDREIEEAVFYFINKYLLKNEIDIPSILKK